MPQVSQRLSLGESVPFCPFGKLPVGLPSGPGLTEGESGFPPPATSGSAGIDLENAQDMDSQLPGEVLLMPTQLRGPLPPGTVGLVLPRSSAHYKGIMTVPGVIDADYTGTIYAQYWGQLPLSLKKGESWSQLLLLPYYCSAVSLQERTGGFGSTRANPLQPTNGEKVTTDSTYHPQIAAVLQHIHNRKPTCPYQIHGARKHSPPRK
ncbi:deoxyuridine 5'-triphosphate nucleotidohydrolase-like [Gopherus flavomarginatus]|uniref:deoxyuridine 5'-triphosphate nucleotidohydrolase-like n=1 Tax=Gopherus flavomarginatus TaxID=286002 RepID=UPI0021CC2FA1|nr:deoxyuridine 5'-triphosphate nucleotidohydrolase-like [Gopherus flavomarginatus]